MFSFESLLKMGINMVTDEHISKFKKFCSTQFIEITSKVELQPDETDIVGMIFLDDDGENIKLATATITEVDGQHQIKRLVSVLTIDELAQLFKKHKDELK